MAGRPFFRNGEETIRGRLALEWLVVSLFALLLVWSLSFVPSMQRANNLIYDTMSGLRTHPASTDIVIVAIDQDSLTAIGRWPWPRSVHTQLLDRLAAAHPKAIGYDVLFLEASPDDAALAAAAKRATPTILPMSFLVPGTNGAAADTELPVPALRAATTVGHAVIRSDDDGIVRRIGLEAGGGKAVWPHMAEALYRATEGHPSSAYRKASEPLPAGEFGLGAPILVPYVGPAGSYQTVPFASVLKGEVPDAVFRDHIVLVGSTSSGLFDQYAVPSGTMPGVEVIANTLDDLKHDRSVQLMSAGLRLVYALVPLAILLIGFLIFSPRRNLVLGFLLIVVTLVTSAVLLLWFDIWLPPAAQLVGIAIVYPLWAWRRLEAASTYMIRELKQLAAERDVLPRRENQTKPSRFLHETIEAQTSMLHNAIVRVRDLRRFFADSVQGLPDPTLILDQEGAVMLANREAEALFDPLIQQGVMLDRLLAFLSPGEVPANPRQDREIKTGDGRIFVFRLVPLLGAEGEPLGSIARWTDITTIRLATRQREEALELLTHDMRSPQASILALLDQNGADQAQMKDRIAGYARRTLELAENFVQFARAEARNFSEELLDLSSLLMDAIDDQWVLASKAKIKLVSTGEEEEHLILGDRSLLTRALVNVIGNALKYSEGGTIVTCALTTEAAAQGKPAMVVCRITDQGRGIPADQLDTLFERYQRLASAGRRDAGGAGLGLSFVRTVITRHGGSIEATSPPGEGATFWIRLPQAEEEV
jgi:CHASE2 domain-containing sensor protein